jgi:sugar-specific transcriptional regulator TrmB
MTDEERQRTMDFILQHQAHFAVGMQRLEEQQSRFAEQQSRFAEQQSRFAEQQTQFSENQQQFSDNQQRMDRRIDQLRRVVLMTVHQFRRERRDLRERIAALVDSQMRTEEAVRSLTATTDRNGRDIALLRRKEPGASGGRKGTS